VKKILYLFIFQIFVSFIFLECAEAANKSQAIPLFIEATTDDSVGQEFLTALRDTIQTSPRYQLVLNTNQSFFQLKIVTLNPTNTPSPTSTIYSVVLTSFTPNDSSLNYYLTNWVGICGEASVSSCANQIFSAADGIMTPFLEVLLKALQKK